MTAKPDMADCALLVVGHGSTVNADSSAPTWAHTDAIRRRGLFAEVHAAFWKEEPGLRQVLYGIRSREVYVVPNFISEGYFTQRVIPRELGLGPRPARGVPVTLASGHTLRYCEPVGSHPRMTEVLLHRAAETAPGVPPGEISLLIAAHGTDLNDNSAAAAKEQVRRIRGLGLYAEVLAAYMDEDPRVEDWARLASSRKVVVVPFFIADGLHSYEDIPERLGLGRGNGGAAVFRRNPHRLGGRELYYASAIGTEPLLADVILDQVAAFEAGCQTAAGVAAPAAPLPPRSAFFQRWLKEGEGGGGGRIGEVAIRSDARAGYVLTHWRDATTDPAALERFTRPEEARAIARFTDEGRYRPLKTAPDLRRGWRLELADPDAVALAVDFLYPAATGVAAAQEEGGRGRLEVVPLRETLGRQSGMYALTRKVSDAGAQVAIASRCGGAEGGGGCLKTILWEIAPGGPAALPGQGTRGETAQEGPPPFPLLCNEACNLLVAAIRQSQKAKQQ